ncbi:MAG: flagellar motor protein MotB [Desulfobulbaceae bacterium]|nr:flagellar motor protein MotB [Desulfobulbaceae bacterium]
MADIPTFVDSPQGVPEHQHSLSDRKSHEFHGSQKVYFDDVFERMRMPRAPYWSVAWSDLMMTMFILFVVLFVYQSSHPEFFNQEKTIYEPGAALEVAQSASFPGPVMDLSGRAVPNIARFYDLSRQILEEEELENFASVDLVPDQTVKIVLTGDLLFDTGRAELKPAARISLQKMIPLLDQADYLINVAGHTDNLPIQTAEFSSNWELSLMRANQVARFLMNESGLPQDRFSVSGHSSFKPISSNEIAVNRAANRRVEIIISRAGHQRVAERVIR